MKKKTDDSKLRTATSTYDPVVKWTTLIPETEEDRRYLQSMNNLDDALDRYEAEAKDAMVRHGADPAKYRNVAYGMMRVAHVEPQIAADILLQVQLMRTALKEGDAYAAGMAGLRIELARGNAVIHAMQTSYRIGEKQRRAEGIPADVLSKMQSAAADEWRKEPRLKKAEVARRIHPLFPRWAPDTIRKKISPRHFGKAV